MKNRHPAGSGQEAKSDLSLPATNRQRRTITLDLPSDQIAWLDQQASTALTSRSAFVRQFLAKAIELSRGDER
jgi:hypothetical protein